MSDLIAAVTTLYGPLLVGVILAIVVAIGARLVGFDRDRAFYPTVLMVVASYYVLFAAMGGFSGDAVLESVCVVGFVILAVLGFRRRPWLVVEGLAAHGVFDFFHPAIIANPGVPMWWPQFCMAYDVTAAAGLALMLIGRPGHRAKLVAS